MNRATRKLLRACVRLVERDVTELADAVVQIDEREVKHWRTLDERLAEIEAVLALRAGYPKSPDDGHGYTGMGVEGCLCIYCGTKYEVHP